MNSVVLCLDARYVWPTCVAVRSLARTWRSAEPLRIHLLTDPSVSPDSLLALHAAAGPAEVTVIQRDFGFPDMRIGYITPMGYARIAAPDLIDAERLLYLDSDMLACVSVHTLLRQIGHDYPIAAARDPYIPELGSRHVETNRFPLGGRAPEFPYFNSGLLAIDVARWRAERLTERAAELIADPGWRPLFGDQDTLNYLIGGRFELLDPRWNVMPVSAVQQRLDFTFHGERYMPAAYQLDLERAPFVMHYATEAKPWTDAFPAGPLRDRWHAVAAEAASMIETAGLPVPAISGTVRPAAHS
ncbi:glycosyltransferase family 8 protein [Catenuloplanes sp. NPDC051500]|uniref:glycosyltransferase family 8 protein n=1 Tax=Catenuloplanes sp. NPDC051500 TaxID=3363959 RepID=UPI0037969F76